MRHQFVQPLVMDSQLGLVGTVDFSRERLVGLNSTAASAKWHFWRLRQHLDTFLRFRCHLDTFCDCAGTSAPFLRRDAQSHYCASAAVCSMRPWRLVLSVRMLADAASGPVGAASALSSGQDRSPVAGRRQRGNRYCERGNSTTFYDYHHAPRSAQILLSLAPQKISKQQIMQTRVELCGRRSLSVTRT